MMENPCAVEEKDGLTFYLYDAGVVGVILENGARLMSDELDINVAFWLDDEGFVPVSADVIARHAEILLPVEDRKNHDQP